MSRVEPRAHLTQLMKAGTDLIQKPEHSMNVRMVTVATVCACCTFSMAAPTKRPTLSDVKIPKRMDDELARNQWNYRGSQHLRNAHARCT
jgi:hypothetical protein